VFNNGIEKEFKVAIPSGGHAAPINIDGSTAKSKKSPKKRKKEHYF
jgi:hypothetical protein